MVLRTLDSCDGVVVGKTFLARSAIISDGHIS
jgi:hypothetical protein